MPTPLVRNLAKRSGKSESEVERVWFEVRAFVESKHDLTEPKESASEAVRSRYYALTVGILKNRLGLESVEETARSLEEIGLKDVAAFFLGTGSKVVRLSCTAKQCKNNDAKGKCVLPSRAIKIDRNWECQNYERKARTSVKNPAAANAAR